MSSEIRPIAPEEHQAFTTAMSVAFGFPEANPEHAEAQRAVCEFDRTLASFDGEEVVGTAGIFSFDMTVPGGALPTAGVTWVSVKPTHRRRGVLTGMMQRQLEDVRERGEPLAALWASESVIYGRYGYGLAAESVRLSIDRTRTSLEHAAPVPGLTRLITREEALSSCPQVYDRVLPTQPGMYSRTDAWWRHHTLRGPDTPRGGFSGRFYVQYEEEGQPLGYARYRIRGGDRDGSPNGTLAVQELMAATEGAYAALWRYIFGVDLIGTIEAHLRRIEEPLLWMLADPRRLIRRPHDSLWLRITDVPAALEGRRYAATGRVVLDVRDEFCPWIEGRYELEGSPEGGRCRRSDADPDPDIVLSAADLGAVFLGGARLQALRRAGRVQGDWESLRRADAMLFWDPPPWCPEVF